MTLLGAAGALEQATAGDWEAEMLGAVLSTFTVTVLTVSRGAKSRLPLDDS